MKKFLALIAAFACLNVAVFADGAPMNQNCCQQPANCCDTQEQTPCDQPVGDCYCKYVHYEPCYYYTCNCEQVPQYYTEKCCRYVPQKYCVTRCRYVPQYYQEECCRYVPQEYCVQKCRYCPKYSYEKHCTYKPCYYYKHECQPNCAPAAQPANCCQ